jgi:transposase
MQAIKALLLGVPRSMAAELFAVSERTAYGWIERHPGSPTRRGTCTGQAVSSTPMCERPSGTKRSICGTWAR